MFVRASRVRFVASLVFLAAIVVSSTYPRQVAAAGSTRAAWLAAQRSFMATLQDFSLGSNDAMTQWPHFLSAFSSYMTDSQAWSTLAAPLGRDLLSTHGLSYGVTDWGSGAERIREAIVTDGSGAPCYEGGHFHALILFWQSSMVVRSQIIAKVQRAPNSSFVPGGGSTLASATMQAGGEDIGDLRSWRSGSTRYMAFVERVICANGGPYDDVRGAILRPGAGAWSHDAAMMPSDLYGAKLDNVSAAFRDREGKEFELDGSLLGSVFQECHVCLHVTGRRILVRTGNVYRPLPWTYTPSAYTTLVRAIGVVEQFIAGNQCLHSIAPYVQTAAIARQLCSQQIAWVNPSVEKYTGDLSVSNTAIAYTFTVSPSNVASRVNIEVLYRHGAWLINSIEPAS
jgi:hypothetical protein